MAMPALVPRYSVDQLDSFPDDGNRYELLDGVLLVTPAPGVPHEFVVVRLRELLGRYLGERALVFTRGAVQLLPHDHLEPDLLVVPFMSRVPKTWADLPEIWLTVEVSGRGSRVYDRDFKHAAYHRLGAQTTWRADMLTRTVTYSSIEGGPSVTTADRFAWRAPGFAEALQIDVAPLFAGIDTDE